MHLNQSKEAILAGKFTIACDQLGEGVEESDEEAAKAYATVRDNTKYVESEGAKFMKEKLGAQVEGVSWGLGQEHGLNTCQQKDWSN